MFCPHCGASGLSSDGICQVCGQQATTSSLDLEPYLAEEGIQETCPNCDSPVGTDEVFCGKCGVRVSMVSNNDSAATDHLKDWNALPQTALAPYPPSRRASEQFNHNSLRAPAAGYFMRRGQMNRTLLKRKKPTERAQSSLAERPRTILIISLLCFLASLISGAAAIWLAISAFH